VRISSIRPWPGGSRRPWPGRDRHRERTGRGRRTVVAAAALGITGLGLAYAGSAVASAPPSTARLASATASPRPAGTTGAPAPRSSPSSPGARAASTGAFTRTSAAGGAPARRACPAPTRAGTMACLTLVRTDRRPEARLAHDAAPAGFGYGPSDLQSAYSLPSTSAGAGRTVAVVDAYDDPSAAADLATYRSAYGLPACTTANGCFEKVNENGKATPLPGASGQSGWATEVSLDLDMVSATCPNCHILLVEANSNGTDDLGTGVDSAVALGAGYVSNSYGGAEISGEQGYDALYFDHPGVAVTAAAGDDGYGASFPASSRAVIAVGGTSLVTDSSTSRGWSETVYNELSSTPPNGATGSGCSGYESKPSWQQDAGCAGRTENDVAADADPATGVAVYDSYDQGGWVEVGGTSASSPIVASTYALAGPPVTGSYPASYLYANHSSLNDVTTGSDGSCNPAYLCTAGPGYDGPTGLGTPDGTGAFGGTPQPVTGAITSGMTGKCADDNGDSSADGNKIDLYTCNGTAAQNWTVGTDGTIRINGKCLDVKGQGTANGSTVDLYDCNGAANQQWKVMPDGQVTGQQSGKCLDDPGWSTANGTQLNIWSCVNQANEDWYLPPPGAVTRPAYSAISDYSGNAGMCLDDSGDSSANDNKIDLYTCNGTAAQNWTAETNGTIQINGKCLDVYQNGSANGSKIDLYTCVNGARNQQWRLQVNGNLVSLASGKCLDDPGYSSANGTQLDIWSCVNQINESWTLP
jgi:Ricin-type beta-trefoil lectin domain